MWSFGSDPMPQHVIPFQHCQVYVYGDDYLETVFEDGCLCPALFQYDDGSKALAAQLGYGDNVRAMHRHHDLAHTFLAEAQGHPYSHVLRRVANGPDVPPEERAAEEGLVLAFQRYLNTGESDPILQKLPNVDALVEQFRAKLRGVWE